MRTLFIWLSVSMTLSFVWLSRGTEVVGQGQSSTVQPKADLKVVKYPELGKAIRALKGKVVVVDIWATWCTPCVREFPNLVALHGKYAADGLVCVSVSMDPTENHAAALSFLTKRQAKFPNYLLDEKAEFAFDRWDIKGIPAVFVFQRDGKRAAKFTHDDEAKPFDYEKDVVPLVRTLLASKE